VPVGWGLPANSGSVHPFADARLNSSSMLDVIGALALDFDGVGGGALGDI